MIPYSNKMKQLVIVILTLMIASINCQTMYDRVETAPKSSDLQGLITSVTNLNQIYMMAVDSDGVILMYPSANRSLDIADEDIPLRRVVSRYNNVLLMAMSGSLEYDDDFANGLPANQVTVARLTNLGAMGIKLVEHVGYANATSHATTQTVTTQTLAPSRGGTTLTSMASTSSIGLASSRGQASTNIMSSSSYDYNTDTKVFNPSSTQIVLQSPPVYWELFPSYHIDCSNEDYKNVYVKKCGQVYSAYLCAKIGNSSRCTSLHAELWPHHDCKKGQSRVVEVGPAQISNKQKKILYSWEAYYYDDRVCYGS